MHRLPSTTHLHSLPVHGIRHEPPLLRLVHVQVPIMGRHAALGSKCPHLRDVLFGNLEPAVETREDAVQDTL